MSKARINAAQGVADRLIHAENSLDTALTATAELVGFLPKARVEARLACEVVHPAFALAADALDQLGKVRATLIAAHQALAKTRDQIGLGEYAFGGLYGKPSAASDSPVLSLVPKTGQNVA
jgi:hypothetical protein